MISAAEAMIASACPITWPSLICAVVVTHESRLGSFQHLSGVPGHGLMPLSELIAYAPLASRQSSMNLA